MKALPSVAAFLFGLVMAAGGASYVKQRVVLRHSEQARSELEGRLASTQKQVEVAEAAALTARAAATELSKRVAEIDATREELAELRKAKDEAEARSQLYAQFERTFKRMIDAGHLSVVVRRGRIVLALPSEVLFDTAKVEIKAEGQAALAEIARALRALRGRKFQVGGHTDALPINTPEFPSNWELSSARAVAVVKLLVAEGVPASMLTASGYGEHEPAASNATHAGRAKNRRIEITLEPNVGALAALPQLKM